MGTKCNIRFADADGNVPANIYRHAKGYPESVLPDLDEFFADVAAQAVDPKFHDPSYLAAKFVVWQAARWRYAGGPLDFGGVGIIAPDAFGAHYSYTVTCGRDRKARPSVACDDQAEDYSCRCEPGETCGQAECECRYAAWRADEDDHFAARHADGSACGLYCRIPLHKRPAAWVRETASRLRKSR